MKRNTYEAIIHEHAVESADRSGNREDYDIAAQAMWDDDESFRDYCRSAEMPDDEIAAALELKPVSKIANI